MAVNTPNYMKKLWCSIHMKHIMSHRTYCTPPSRTVSEVPQTWETRSLLTLPWQPRFGSWRYLCLCHLLNALSCTNWHIWKKLRKYIFMFTWLKVVPSIKIGTHKGPLCHVKMLLSESFLDIVKKWGGKPYLFHYKYDLYDVCSHLDIYTAAFLFDWWVLWWPEIWHWGVAICHVRP